MPEVDPSTVLVIAVAMVAGGLVKGVIGLGLPIVSLPLLTFVMDVPAAISMLLVSLVLTNLVQAWQSGLAAPAARRFWALTISLGLGTYVGASFSTLLDPRWLYVIVALFTFLFVGLGFSRFEPRVPAGGERWLGPAVGLVSGLMGGMSSMFGPPFAIYLAALRVGKDEFVAAISIFMTVGSIFLALAFWRQGVMDGRAWLASGLAFLPALAGLQIGAWVRTRVDQARFRKIVYLFLLVLAANLLRRAMV